MDIWILVALIGAIAVPVVLLTRWKRRESKDSTRMTLGLTLVALGIVFSEDPLVGYSFIGAGVSLSVIGAVSAKGMSGRRSKT